MNTQVDLLQTPIEFLKGVGPKRADVLRKEFEIFTFEDLLLYYPYRHIDKSKIYKIADIQSEEYYINMVRAWFFATALTKQYEAAVTYLEEQKLDVWTHNKAIQKARESYRVPIERKEYLKSMKR